MPSRTLCGRRFPFWGSAALAHHEERLRSRAVHLP